MNAVIILMPLFCLLTMRLNAEVKQSDPVSVVKAICEGEFNGVQEMRMDTTRLSPKEKERLSLGSMSYVVFWNENPIFVVSTFTIVGADINHDKAVVSVMFDIVLDTKGLGHTKRMFVKKCAREEVKYNLIKADGKWFAYDPPKAGISMEALIKYYRAEFKFWLDKDIWDKEAYSDDQRLAIKKYGEHLNFLKKVYNDKTYCKSH